jgi:hypothetical protein
MFRQIPTLDCRNEIALRGIVEIRAGAAPETVEVLIAHVDASNVRRACAPGAARPATIDDPPPAGHGLVSDGMVREGWFVLDLNSRRLAPLTGVARR